MKPIAIFLAGFLLFEALAGLAGAQEPVPVPAVQTVDQGLVANLLTVINIPARGALCGLNTVLAAIVMGASAGRRYADAATVMDEGCAGPWIITPEMIEQGPPEKDKASGDLFGIKPY